MDAATGLLYESYNHLEKISELQKAFGTPDIETIYKQTDGVVHARYAEGIQYLSELRSDKLNWTAEHFLELRRVLKLIKDNKNGVFSELEESAAIRTLADFPDITVSGSRTYRMILGG
jgi:hypothetical protein